MSDSRLHGHNAVGCPRWLRLAHKAGVMQELFPDKFPLQNPAMAYDRLLTYPCVKVRIGCELCARQGTYRLTRLAARFGPEITLEDLLAHLTVDCEARNPRHPYHRDCQARYVDLDPPRRPPDNPAVTMKLVQGGKR